MRGDIPSFPHPCNERWGKEVSPGPTTILNGVCQHSGTTTALWTSPWRIDGPATVVPGLVAGAGVPAHAAKVPTGRVRTEGPAVGLTERFT